MDRRKFLKYSASLATSAAFFPLSSADASTLPVWEGIYTSRFTHRSGIDPIEIHASLLDVTSVDVTLVHRDGLPGGVVIGVYTIAVDDTQISSYSEIPTGGAGVLGPEFPVRLSLDTQTLAPGLYEASIDPLVLRPENRQNFSGAAFDSNNSVCRFVVTASIPGSVSKLLWLHDSLTPTAYGAFGAESIYGGPAAAGVRTVSYRRPGLDDQTLFNGWLLRWLKTNGYEFEFMDVIDFASQPPSITEAYELIVACGQFEYLPHSFLSNLRTHTDAGGCLLICSNEFAAFRVTLDTDQGTMTTYKWDAPSLDPGVGVDRAGIGMHNSDTIWETELTGLSVWGAHNMGGLPKQDLVMTNTADTGWLLAGTGFTDVIPAFVHSFSAGNRGVMLSGNRFNLIDTALSRTPSDTVVWGATASQDARRWEQAPLGTNSPSWPIDPDGHALCTWRAPGNGSRTLALASQGLLQNFFYLPGYSQLFKNMFSYLTSPDVSSPVPSSGALAKGVLSASLAEVGRRMIRPKG